MDERIKREQTLLATLESVLTPDVRKRTERELDAVREAIEENASYGPMDAIVSYVKSHTNYESWKKAYTGKGFTNAQYLVSSLMHASSALRSLLLYHGVGVGKTCAAIAAASSYKGNA